MSSSDRSGDVLTLHTNPPPARAGTDLQLRHPAALPAPRSPDGRTQGQHPEPALWRTHRPADIVPVPARNEPLDALAKRAYASAGVGFLIAAAAAAGLSYAGRHLQGRLSQLLLVLLALGACMTVGGGITGSARPRSHFGGAR